jgi:hypothetical protein
MYVASVEGMFVHDRTSDEARKVDSRMLARLRCYLRDHHNPSRHPLGGFKCSDCGTTGVDLEEMGFEDAGYVATRRPWAN